MHVEPAPIYDICEFWSWFEARNLEMGKNLSGKCPQLRKNCFERPWTEILNLPWRKVYSSSASVTPVKVPKFVASSTSVTRDWRIDFSSTVNSYLLYRIVFLYILCIPSCRSEAAARLAYLIWTIKQHTNNASCRDLSTLRRAEMDPVAFSKPKKWTTIRWSQLAGSACAMILLGAEEVRRPCIERRNPSRLYLCRPQLLPNPLVGMSWQIVASSRDRAFITTMGFDV
jgi:hypothetical protein